MYKKLIFQTFFYLSLFNTVLNISDQLTAFEKFIEDSRPILRNRRDMQEEDAYDIEKRMLDAAFKNVINEDAMKLEIEMEQNLRSAQDFDELLGHKRDIVKQSKQDKQKAKEDKKESKASPSVTVSKESKTQANTAIEPKKISSIKAENSAATEAAEETKKQTQAMPAVSQTNQQASVTELQSVKPPKEVKSSTTQVASNNKDKSNNINANNIENSNKNTEVKNTNNNNNANNLESQNPQGTNKDLEAEGVNIVEREKLNNVIKDGLRHEAIMAYINGDQKNSDKDKATNEHAVQTKNKQSRLLRSNFDEAELMESNLQMKVNSYKPSSAEEDESADSTINDNSMDSWADYQEPQFVTEAKKNVNNSWREWLINHPSVYLAASNHGVNNIQTCCPQSKGIVSDPYGVLLDSKHSADEQTSQSSENNNDVEHGPAAPPLKSMAAPVSTFSADYLDNQSKTKIIATRNSMPLLETAEYKQNFMNGAWKNTMGTNYCQPNAKTALSQNPQNQNQNQCNNQMNQMMKAHPTNSPADANDFWRDYTNSPLNMFGAKEPSATAAPNDPADAGSAGGLFGVLNALPTPIETPPACKHFNKQPAPNWRDPNSKQPIGSHTATNFDQNQYPNDLSHEADYKLSSFEQNTAHQANKIGKYPSTDYACGAKKPAFNAPSNPHDHVYNLNNWKISRVGDDTLSEKSTSNDADLGLAASNQKWVQDWYQTIRRGQSDEENRDAEQVWKTQNTVAEDFKYNNLKPEQQSDAQVEDDEDVISLKNKFVEEATGNLKRGIFCTRWPLRNPVTYDFENKGSNLKRKYPYNINWHCPHNVMKRRSKIKAQTTPADSNEHAAVPQSEENQLPVADRNVDLESSLQVTEVNEEHYTAASVVEKRSNNFYPKFRSVGKAPEPTNFDDLASLAAKRKKIL